MQRLKLFIPLIIFAVLAVFFFVVQKQIGSGDYNPENMPSALINKPLPAFELPDLQSGTTVSNDLLKNALLKNKVALVNVWATWCPSCAYEHLYLVKLAQRGVVVLGVDYKDEPDKARQWLSEKGNPYIAVLDDRAGKLGLDLGVTGAPETYVIDRNGIVLLRYQGPLDQRVWDETFKPLFDRLQKSEQLTSEGAGG